MLALFLACTISAGGVKAQTNTEYNFRQQSVADGVAFNANGDSIPVLSMNSLAANGYGQWTLSSMPGSGGGGTGATAYPAGWYLLTNGLYAPSTGYASGNANHIQCIPPGVVQNAALPTANFTEAQATANLDGEINYIWPDASNGYTNRFQFIIDGFNPSDINISLPSGFPNSANSRNVVKNPITQYIFSTADIHGVLHDVVHDETDPRDDCNEASDAALIYVTWCSTTNLTSPHTREIWVTVLNAITRLPIDNTWPRLLGQGARPTIACDPRQNRGGTITPIFDVAFITGVPSAIFFPDLVSESYNGSVFHVNPLMEQFLNPNGLYTVFANVTHVRALVSPVAGQTALTHGLYVIGQTGLPAPAGEKELVFYSFPTNPPPATSGYYVDGDQRNTYPAPVPAAGVGQNAPILLDEPIVAFANPYDQQNYLTGTPYDQFHCVYQLDVFTQPYPYTAQRMPLLIVEGWNNGMLGTTDTRLVMNQLYPIPTTPSLLIDDPVTYCAAVNQMGIHVHWRTLHNEHYYSRDAGLTTSGHYTGAFDEPIDENTLVTDQCFVSDGSSHGGTVGATIKGSKYMTVWTDPNYGAPAITSTTQTGLYTPLPTTSTTTFPSINPYVGTLNFSGSNVILNVGDGINCGGDEYYICPATLTVMPYFYFNFPGTGQGVTVQPNSTFDYFGLYATYNSSGVQTAIGTPFTDGTADGYGAGTIKLEGIFIFDVGIWSANLNVHGGADFYTGPGVQTPYNSSPPGILISNLGFINIQHENSVYPITNSPSGATGHMTLRGETSLTNTNIIGNAISGTNDIILTVKNGFIGNTTTLQFLASTCTIQNTDKTGTTELDFGDQQGDGFSTTTITGCTCDAISIHGVDPDYASGAFDVDGSSFSDLRNKCIFVENTADPQQYSTYGWITITGNNFGSFASNASLSDQISGIYLKNFDVPYFHNDLQPLVEVNNNLFTYSDNTLFSTYSGPAGGIILENTTSYVINNTISDNGYPVGIFAHASLDQISSQYPFSYSLICSNTISGMRTPNQNLSQGEIGILTESSKGYVKLNTISNCDNCFTSYISDGAKLVFNSFAGTSTYPTMAIGSSSTVDMSGVHGTGNDVGAYNIVSGPATNKGMIWIEDNSSIIFANNFALAWLDWGRNQIFLNPRTNGSKSQILFLGTATSGCIHLNNLDRNFWTSPSGPALVPNHPCPNTNNWNASDASEIDASGVDFNTSMDTPESTALAAPPFSCDTSLGYTYAGKKGAVPASVDTGTDTCLYLFGEGYEDNASGLYQQSYDTLMLFVERCPFFPDYPASWRAFNIMGADIGILANNDTSLVHQYQLWLESVLYLNTIDPEYFCQCVFQIGTGWYYPTDTSRAQSSKGTNKELAVIQWLLQNTNCDTALLNDIYRNTRQSQYADWLDDSTHGYYYPLDTTIPPLDSIQPGLKELLEKHFLYATVTGTPPPSILSNATANPNPVTEGTVISFSIAKEAYVKIELFDVLGKQASSYGYESLFEPGNKSVSFSLAGLPSGTYYARIISAYGEVQSVKLVKE